MSNSTRLDYIDSAKGVLITLVVIGHMLQMKNVPLNHISAFIYSFHMPAFFIISGALFNTVKWHYNGFITFLKNRFQTLIIPWIFFELQASVFILMLRLIQRSGTKMTLHVFISVLIPIIKNANPLRIWTNCGANWFLVTLFFGEIAVFTLSKLEHEKLILVIIFLIAITKAVSFPLKSLAGGNWIGRLILSTIFILIGCVCKEIIIKPPAISIVPCLFFVLVTAKYNGVVDLSSFSVNHLLAFIISGISGAFFVIGISALLDSRLLCKIGQESLTIMGTHQLIKYCITSLFPNHWIFSMTNAIVFLVSICVFECFYIPFINRTAPRFVGKKSNQ